MRAWLLLVLFFSLPFFAMWVADKLVGPDDPDGDDQW